VPYLQLGTVSQLTLHVRTETDPKSMMPVLLEAIGAIDQGVTAFRGRTMTRQIEDHVVA
jgi:hypothetical protein